MEICGAGWAEQKEPAFVQSLNPRPQCSPAGKVTGAHAGEEHQAYLRESGLVSRFLLSVVKNNRWPRPSRP